MYNLPYFKDPDDSQVESFLRKNSFALICGADAAGNPVATQVPLLIDKQDGHFRFRGHLMKQTDHHKAFAANNKVLVVFTGAHTYVSASWYTNPLQGSTWNYMTVQARGSLNFLDNSSLEQILRETTAHYENDPNSPSLYDKLPPDDVEGLTKAILGFEIIVADLKHTFKLSQNRDDESYRTIISKLSQGSPGAKEIAREMIKRYDSLYSHSKENDSP